MSEQIAIVGASGFIGRHLVARLHDDADLRLFGRTAGTVGGVQQDAWSAAASLAGCRTLIHLAAIATTYGSSGYEQINVQLPLEVLEAFGRAGGKRFIFISSIVVHGRTAPKALEPSSPYAPDDAYARSKVDAEVALKERAPKLGVELCIVRPPVVYGRGGERNTLGLIGRALRRHLPLPLGRATAKRSLIAVENLADCLAAIATAPSAIACMLPADANDYGMREVVQMLGRGRMPVNLPVPRRLFAQVFTLAGRRHLYAKFFEPLCVDRAHWTALDWAPRLDTATALASLMAS